MLDTDFIQCIMSAVEKDDMSLVQKGNAKVQKWRNVKVKWRNKSEETKSELDILLNEVKNLKEKRRKLLHQ